MLLAEILAVPNPLSHFLTRRQANLNGTPSSSAIIPPRSRCPKILALDRLHADKAVFGGWAGGQWPLKITNLP
jgi:hypothetical protein